MKPVNVKIELERDPRTGKFSPVHGRSKDRVSLSFKVMPEFKERIDKYCQNNEIPITQLVIEAIEDKLKELEIEANGLRV